MGEIILRDHLKILKDESIEIRRKFLQKQGYRIIGNHSAIKLCHYCKSSLKDNSSCYKNKFYGIDSWRCIQASVTLDVCNLRCQWCWRDIDYNPKKIKFLDNTKDIVEGFIKEQKKALIGYFGYNKVNKEKLLESMKPKHVALSLTGDACMYPRLPELIEEIHKRKMTSFLVTNGTFIEMIKELIDHQPTQLYITLPAPDEETFEEVCKPLAPGLWRKIMNSLSLLKHFKRSTVRLTLGKGWNFKAPEKYAEIINKNKFNFLEIKSAMPVGGARYRMGYEQMPKHEEIQEFSERISELTDFSIIDEQPQSQVVLMSKKDDKKVRFLEV